MEAKPPTAGVGAVFFDLLPRRALINDSNTGIILTYRVIKEQCEDLLGRLALHHQHNGREYYYHVRNADRNAQAFEGLTALERAARFIFLNKTCYNGLYRVNDRGCFNVSYGAYKNPTICEAARTSGAWSIAIPPITARITEALPSTRRAVLGKPNRNGCGMYLSA